MGYSKLLGMGTALLVASAVTATADEELDMMLKDALPVMLHSCNTVTEETGGDEEQILEIVRKMVAVSLINRNIDISDYVSSEDEFEALRADFIEVVRAGCEADRNALLAGVIDKAVKEVLKL